MKSIFSTYISIVIILFSSSFVFACNACPGEDPADLERQTIRGAIIFVIVLAALIGLIFWRHLKQK